MRGLSIQVGESFLEWLGSHGGFLRWGIRAIWLPFFKDHSGLWWHTFQYFPFIALPLNIWALIQASRPKMVTWLGKGSLYSTHSGPICSFYVHIIIALSHNGPEIGGCIPPESSSRPLYGAIVRTSLLMLIQLLIRPKFSQLMRNIKIPDTDTHINTSLSNSVFIVTKNPSKH